jgi:hypothetical protein
MWANAAPGSRKWLRQRVSVAQYRSRKAITSSYHLCAVRIVRQSFFTQFRNEKRAIFDRSSHQTN